jgi:hypothetical protein
MWRPKKKRKTTDPASLLKWCGAHDDKALSLIVQPITHHALPRSLIQTREWCELRPESQLFGKDLVHKAVDAYVDVKKAVHAELLASAPRTRLPNGHLDPTAPPVVPLHLLTKVDQCAR